MSGRKVSYVSVASDELQELKKAQSRLQMVRKDLPKLLNGVQSQVRGEFERRFAEFDARQQRFDTAVENLGAEVRVVEASSQRRLNEQARWMRKALDHDISLVRDEMSARLNEQTDRLHRAVAEESVARRRDMSMVAKQLHGLEDTVRAERKRAEKVAKQWLSGAEVLRGFIERELAHQRFAPGRLDALSQELADAENNGQAGLWQAAAVAAQTAHRQLSELRSTLELQEREHLALNAQAHEQILVLRGHAEANALLPLSEGTPAPKDGSSFVDYWTRGQHRVVAGEISELVRKVEADELDREQLSAALREDIPRLRTELDTLVEAATAAEIGSQLRASIADRVVEVLAGNGYDCAIDGGYEGSDQRCGFLAKADHPDGSRIVVTVLPVNDKGTAELSVHSFDEDTADDETRLRRAQALAEQLREEGLQLTPLVEVRGGPDPRMHDVPGLLAGQPGRVTAAPRAMPA
jgi:hypothetical protein